MRVLFAAAAAVALAVVPALASEATFDRTLTVSGPVELYVSTGSGSIHLTRGADNQVHVFGRVRSGWGGNEDRVQEIANHPPIEQTGSIVRIGQHSGPMNNISIDYEIQAPANVFLDAGTGSGNVTDDGTGQDAKLHTGSGSIRATGLHGSFALDTGSGNIYADQTGEGDVKAQTGSGSIELRNLHGGLRAETGSGGIKVSGTPDAPWRLETGSGSVEFWTGGAALTLDAQTGSGSIHSDRAIMMQGTLGRHHLTGQLDGGGPTVRIETGSGDIRIH